jgi:hypothetical protein
MSSQPSAAPHGTNARYQVEVRGGGVPCDSCLAARRRTSYSWRRRNTTKCAKGLGWPMTFPLPGDEKWKGRGR